MSDHGIMVDLETLGVRAGCKILSIGAVSFSTSGLGLTFYASVDPAEQDQFGLLDDPDTVAWWAKQSSEARRVFTEPKMPIRQALIDFADFYGAYNKRQLWGNGADFDNVILDAVYHAVKVPRPWGPYSNRCYRTLKGLQPGLRIVRSGTHHNALDDAKTQALHAIKLLETLER